MDNAHKPTIPSSPAQPGKVVLVMESNFHILRFKSSELYFHNYMLDPDKWSSQAVL